MRFVALLVLCALCSPAWAQKRHPAEARAEVQKLLSGGNPNVAVSRLRYLGEERLGALTLQRAWLNAADPAQQRDIAQVLADLGQSDSEPLFVEFTRSTDPAVRMNGARGLGQLRSKEAAALLPLLQDSSMAVRREAARALGATGDRRQGRALVAAAKTEGEIEVRAALLVAAGRTGDRRVIPALEAQLTSSSESTRFAAARGLCLLRSPSGFAFARRLLGSEDRFVRRQGVQLFEGLPSKVASSHLTPVLKDADPRVAAAAARILYEGGDRSRLAWLVLASHHAPAEHKDAYESELEALMLTDAQRRDILVKAGLR